MNLLGFFIQKNKKKIFEQPKNQKPKVIFRASSILHIFSWKFHGLVWLNLYSCEAVQQKLKNSLKTQKMHFLPVLEHMSDTFY